MQSNPTAASPHVSQTTIEQLGDCLRGELAATNSYEIALKAVQHVGLHRSLQSIFASHAGRATRLRRKLLDLGAEPPDGVGAWGVFASIMQHGADILGNRAAMSVLEQGEDHQLEMYEAALKTVDPTTRSMIEQDLLAEQRKTHDLCRDLKRYTESPS